ncbi:hypothetical protein [Streptomyces sp. NPDC003480]
MGPRYSGEDFTIPPGGAALWLGSSGTALKAADGHDPRNRPAFFQRIKVTG